jgi:hypothetical protein
VDSSQNHKGFAIALAWPETLCKQAGAWYEGIMSFTGFNVDGYYKVGHAAIVLIDEKDLSCQYFDFGRYHAPFGSGRVRNTETDHDLRIETKAVLSDDGTTLINVNQILGELFRNPSTHGSGTIHGTATRIDFKRAYMRAQRMQEKNFIEYGPFLPQGTNCSRFVNSILIAGKPSWIQRMKLKFPLTISPTPMWNLRAIGGKKYRFELYSEQTVNVLQELNTYDIVVT